jgi:hypothetical protein
MVGGIPLRRHLTVNWFAVMARVGRTGNEEHALVFDPRTHTAKLKARIGGEVFSFVNDAVIAVPGLVDFFYRSNRGTARVRIRPHENTADAGRERSE